MFFVHSHRGIIAIGGQDRKSFLQGLITNDVFKAPCLYAAMLSPQGKFQHDFFIFDIEGTLYITPEKDRLPALLQRLTMYRLRSDVTLTDVTDQWTLVSGKDEKLDIWFDDPRHADLGHIGLAPTDQSIQTTWTNYPMQRMTLGIPDGQRDMKIDKGIILENNLDELNAIDWKKGCYMGQELISRTKHVGQIRKRLLPVRIEGPVPPLDSDVMFEGEKSLEKVGEMRSVDSRIGLALLRLEYVQKSLETGQPMQGEGGALLHPEIPGWLKVDWSGN
jgi:tRNA-modifying protein YgfZ